MAETTGRLTWDDLGEKVYELGTDRGVVYPQSSSGTYPQGSAWNGLTGVTYTPSGAEATKIYANNGQYGSLLSAEEVGGTVTAYTYPDEFAQCNGEKDLVEGVRVGQQTRTPFGLTWRTFVGNDTEGQEHAYIIHIMYGCQASPSEKAYTTVSDSPEAIEFSWELTTTPVNVTGMKPTAYLEIDSRTVSAEALTALENKLYGTDQGVGGTPAATAATLPLPDEIKQIVTSAGA